MFYLGKILNFTTYCSFFLKKMSLNYNYAFMLVVFQKLNFLKTFKTKLLYS